MPSIHHLAINKGARTRPLRITNRSVIVLIVALAQLVCMVHTVAAQVPLAYELPYSGYVDLIVRIESAAANDQPLDALSDDLAAVTAIRLPGGAMVPVDNAGLVELMRGIKTSGDKDRLVTAARALLHELRVTASSSDGMATTDAMLRRRDVLADPELQRPMAAPEPPPELPQVDLAFLRPIIMALGAIAVVVLIMLVGPLLFRFFVTVRRRRQHGPPAQPGLEVATSAEAIQRAQVASAIQDYRLALRMLYLASLLKLGEIGALNYDRAQTNREYVRQVALRPALANALWPVVETFDDVWYGFMPITPEGYRAFESKVGVLIQAAEAIQTPGVSETPGV
ncbi:MAG: DUF4129 domain-containing protein [Chloroflexi bacterium]|nr:DUF4129 domain-containing protein [Chloroflexota bacterium]